jgi:hypothetical protein
MCVNSVATLWHTSLPVAAETCLASRCLALDFSAVLLWLHTSGVQASCHTSINRLTSWYTLRKQISYRCGRSNSRNKNELVLVLLGVSSNCQWVKKKKEVLKSPYFNVLLPTDSLKKHECLILSYIRGFSAVPHLYLFDITFSYFAFCAVNNFMLILRLLVC